MTDESAFQAGLDEKPDNHDLRLVFADWLEDQGDPRAPGYRWMGLRQKHPQYFVHPNGQYPPDWNWRSDHLQSTLHASVPELFQHIQGHQRSTSVWKEYATRQAAEDALALAIAEESNRRR